MENINRKMFIELFLSSDENVKVDVLTLLVNSQQQPESPDSQNDKAHKAS